MWWNGQAPLENIDQALALVEKHALSICPQLAPLWFPRVWFEPYTFKCGDSSETVHGCQPWYYYGDLMTVQIGWRLPISQTALCDELLHSAWEVCQGGPGEANDGGGLYYQLPFGEAVGACRADMAQYDVDDGGRP